VAHSVAADDTGTVQIDSGTAGATATADVILGETCVIEAIGTAGSIFDLWYLTADLDTPLSGYAQEQEVSVVDTMGLTAKFVAEADLEDRWLAIENYNNNESEGDPSLGIIDASYAEGAGEEVEKPDWDGFVAGTTPAGDPPAVAGDRYFTMTGTKAVQITATANASLGFMQWLISYLIPVPESSPTSYTLSSPTVLSTSPSITISTNKHYKLTAVWGEPVSVTVGAGYATGNDPTHGEFLLEPVTSARQTVQNGVTDSYVQGSTAVFTAIVANGYVFSGWYSDLAGTTLVSAALSYSLTVAAPVTLYAKFAPDTDAVYKWGAGDANKMIEWRSKRYVASRPFNPSSARVYASAYPVQALNVFMCSSPDSPAATPTVAVIPKRQDGFRLPMARPEKYLEIEVQSSEEVSEIAVSTAMGGLAG
jgi:uncharacterized repeat protein (TIGR02543 family)